MRHFEPRGWKDVVLSSEDGSFRIGRMGDGDHWVLIDPPADFLRAEPVRAPAGAMNLQIVLREGTSAVIRVLDPEGRPVRGAAVLASTQRKGRDHSRPRTQYGTEASTGDDGTVLVPHLERGVARVLTIDPPDANDDLLDRVMEGWVPANTTVRLERGDGPHLVGTHQAAVSNYVRSQYCCQPALHPSPRHRVQKGEFAPEPTATTSPKAIRFRLREFYGT
jgi:hypothetical protein